MVFNPGTDEAIYTLFSGNICFPLRSFVHSFLKKVISKIPLLRKLISWLDDRKLLSYGKKVLDNSAYSNSDWTGTLHNRYLTSVD